jgi:hypothetical protein
MTLEEIRAELVDRRTFRQVFCNSAEGQAVLAWTLNEAGYFSTDPQLVDPVMIAFCNRLLAKTGIVHGKNIFEDTRARTELANDRDLRALEEQLKREEV